MVSGRAKRNKTRIQRKFCKRSSLLSSSSQQSELDVSPSLNQSVEPLQSNDVEKEKEKAFLDAMQTFFVQRTHEIYFEQDPGPPIPFQIASFQKLMVTGTIFLPPDLKEEELKLIRHPKFMQEWSRLIMKNQKNGILIREEQQQQ